MGTFVKSILSVTAVAAFLLGCGGEDQRQPSDRALIYADRPPESFDQARSQAPRTADDYDYVHAHLARIDYMQCTHWDWAVVARGSCPGYFLEGSQPFSEVGGKSGWEKFGGRAGPVPRAARSIPAVADAGIRIIQATDSGRSIECFIGDRSSGDCYTSPDQRGKATGQPGGPLSLDAHFPSHGDNYVFVRGFCKKSDPLCTPH